MKKETEVSTKKGKLVKFTHTKGIDIGDFYYVLYNSEGNVVRKFSNRETPEINKAIQFYINNN